MPPPPSFKPKFSPPPAPSRSYAFEVIIAAVFIMSFGAAFLPFINGDFAFTFANYLLVVEKYVAPFFIILDVFFLAGIIYAVIKYKQVAPKFSIFERAPKKSKKEKDPKIKLAWDKIMAKAVGAPLDSLRLVLIEADAFVDSFLKREGYEGDHMADRLSRIDPIEMRSLDRLWAAHRLRNDVVHTPGFGVRPEVAQDALKAFDDFLKELGAI